MSSVCFYFQVHQPRRIMPGHMINVSNINTAKKLEKSLFDEKKNKEVIKKVAGKCYFPANNLMLEQIDLYKSQNKKFKISYSLSGVFLDTIERHEPDLLESFRQLAKTGCVEFLNETYFHSLSSFWGEGVKREEFEDQVRMNRDAVKSLFGYESKVFRNTELLFNNMIAKTVEKMGYIGMLSEGIEWILDGWRSPEHVYGVSDSNLAILLRHYKLSDDMSYRFSARWFSGWPVTAEKYAHWLSKCPGETINLFMDYETFGEHQWEDTGIFNFLKQVPYEVLKTEHMDFATPSEVIKRYPKRGNIDVSVYDTISWADLERDPSAWLGNDMQRFVFRELERVGEFVKASGDAALMSIWRNLQTSDHLYYMCTKNWGDGDVHKYFSPYGTPQEAFEGMVKSISQLEFVAKKTLENQKQHNLLSKFTDLSQFKF